MPTRPPHPCLQPGCPQLTTNTRCPTHTAQHEQRRGTRQQRGLGQDHTRNGTAAIQAWVTLHGWTCPGWQTPPHPVQPGQLTRDHITPRHHGGTNHPDNYSPLCLSCNSRKGNRA